MSLKKNGQLYLIFSLELWKILIYVLIVKILLILKEKKFQYVIISKYLIALFFL